MVKFTITYIEGVVRIVAGAGAGVEKELTAFQRLARYPGVDENDCDTDSVIEKELPSFVVVWFGSGLDSPFKSFRGKDGLISSAIFRDANLDAANAIACAVGD